jgi:putative Holliday junction resolvase
VTLSEVAELPSGRLLGVDLGTDRIGLALSDPEQVIASPLATLSSTGLDIDEVVALLALKAVESEASGVVFGSPRTLHGREGRAASRSRRVAKRLAQESGLPVALVDERFSTVEATRVMREQDVDERAGRSSVDRVAAALILQQAIERRRNA